MPEGEGGVSGVQPGYISQALAPPEWRDVHIKGQEPCGCPHDQAVENAARHLPDLTASIDVALTFSEKGLPASIRRVFDNPDTDAVTADSVTAEGDRFKDHGATSPLAIFIATLAAVETRGPEHVG